MRVLVAGASGEFGAPVMDELRLGGHEVIGLTRSPTKADAIEGRGDRVVVADVLDRKRLRSALAFVQPEAVISLLVTLPKYGPRHPTHVHPNLPLWSTGVPNLIAAAREAGATRFVGESFVFAYGYDRYGPAPLTEEKSLAGGAVIDGQAEILEGLRGMEEAITGAEGLDGIALRYGGRHGRHVPMRAAMARALRWHLPVLPGGGHALLPFVEIGDAAKATVAALQCGKGGEIYNVVDDRPIELREYAKSLADDLGVGPPRSIPLGLFRRFAPYMACVLDHTRLPVSNQKAKRELGWEPVYPTVADTFAAGAG